MFVKRFYTDFGYEIIVNKQIPYAEVKIKLSLYLTNKALRHEGLWGSGCIDSHFLDLGTSWR
jgi:hypothetical protein